MPENLNIFQSDPALLAIIHDFLGEKTVDLDKTQRYLPSY